MSVTKTTTQSFCSSGRVPPPAQVTGIVSCLLGQQKGALPSGAGHDVRPDGVAVPASLRNAAQGRAEGTEAESHIQNRLRQQVNALPSEKMLSPPTHPLLPFLPPQTLGFIFRHKLSWPLSIWEKAVTKAVLVCLCHHPPGTQDRQPESRLAYAVVITRLRDLGHSFNLLPRGWGAQSCWLTFGLVVILFLHLQN